MYEIHVKEEVDKKFYKMGKRNPKQLEIISKKLKEISNNPDHYKPLKGSMKGLRRVHIDSSFVLIFEIDEKNKRIMILDYDHHDKIYSFF